MAISDQRELEAIPGTEILLLTNDSTSDRSDNEEKIRLVPKPSVSPDDPLVSNPKSNRECMIS